MDWFKNMNMGVLTIAVGTISVIGWVTVGGTIALVISIIAGGLIAMKGAMGAEE